VGIEKFGPIGVVDLADRAGRDHTTISRQVAKLESLGLVERRASQADRRVREAVVTAKGEAMTRRINGARERILSKAFSTWEPNDLDELVRLTRKYADALNEPA
jgi:DNA-binding MarR family transcriptional regulator